MKSLEQLNALSDYEINCAVADKYLPCEYILDGPEKQVWLANFIGDTSILEGYAEFNPCAVANDYMPIAIEHGISIKLRRKSDIGLPYASAPLCDRVYADSNDKIPRAVCIAYLLM